MNQVDSIQEALAAAGAQFMAYGGGEQDSVQVAESFGTYELEYAAIHQRVGIMYLPQRGLLQLTGTDVKDFLHRLLTQDIAAMKGGQSKRTFALTRQGRVLADAIVHFGDACTWIEADVFDIPTIAKLLDDMLFGEDVTLEDISQKRAVFDVLGPSSGALLSALSHDAAQAAMDLPGTHHVVELAGEKTTISRIDSPNATIAQVRVFTSLDHAATLYAALLDAAGFDANPPDAEQDPQAAAEAAAKRRDTLRGRPVGWLAYNTVRIESGRPLFHIDFGPDSLPHETGVLQEAVSFTKGCYTGQEIVARMESRKSQKKILVGLRMNDDRLPLAGAQVMTPSDHESPGDVVGAITSSAVSPVLGNAAIAFAVVKWAMHEPGTPLAVPAEGQMVDATVHQLRFMED